MPFLLQRYLIYNFIKHLKGPILQNTFFIYVKNFLACLNLVLLNCKGSALFINDVQQFFKFLSIHHNASDIAHFSGPFNFLQRFEIFQVITLNVTYEISFDGINKVYMFLGVRPLSNFPIEIIVELLSPLSPNRYCYSFRTK